MDFFFSWEGEDNVHFDDNSTARDSLIDDPDIEDYEKFSPYEKSEDEEIEENEELYNEYKELYSDIDAQEGLNVAEILGLAGAYVTEYDPMLSEQANIKETKKVSMKEMMSQQKSSSPSYTRKTRFEKWSMDVALGNKTIHDPLD